MEADDTDDISKDSFGIDDLQYFQISIIPIRIHLQGKGPWKSVASSLGYLPDTINRVVGPVQLRKFLPLTMEEF